MTRREEDLHGERHLSQLEKELYLRGELSRDRVEHVRGCERCQAVLAVMGAHDEAWRSDPPEMPRRDTPPTPERAPRVAAGVPRWSTGRLSAAAAGVAAVTSLALAAVFFAPAVGEEGASQDVVRAKGGDWGWGVVLEDAGVVRVATGDDTVYPGTRVGFQVTLDRPGHLLIVGVDEARDVYMCYPGRGARESALVEDVGAPVKLDAAIRFDDKLGKEHLIAVLCEQPVTLEQVEPRLGAAPTSSLGREGCEVKRIVLNKIKRESE